MSSKFDKSKMSSRHITDGWFTGATRGFCIGHVGPEAAVGGPIALLRDGEQITIDGGMMALGAWAGE